MTKFTLREATVSPVDRMDGPGLVIANAAANQHKQSFLRRIPYLFLALVVLPVTIAAIYLFMIASPMYVSEARFVVRKLGDQAPAGLDAIFRGSSIGGGSDETFAVHAYVGSRAAVEKLVEAHDLRKALNPPDSDPLSRFPRPWEGDSFEQLHSAYDRYVTVMYDATSGISTLRVKAFDPVKAAEFANVLLDGGEAIINSMNDRATRDSLVQAEAEVELARANVERSRTAVTNFRNEGGDIDPGRSSAAAGELVGALEVQLSALKAQRLEIEAAAPESPQLPVLNTRIEALELQVRRERAKIAGNKQSLAQSVGTYEELLMQRQFADKMLEVAITARERSRVEAQKQKLYLERIAEPNVPDHAKLPRRWYQLITVVFCTLALYAMAVLILSGLKERGRG